MRKTISTALALSLMLSVALTSGGAGADSRCSSPLVVLSRTSANPVASVNWNGAACVPSNFAGETAAIADGPVDFRIITPGSDLVTISYVDEVRFDPAYIHARLDGLGFDRYRILLPHVAREVTGEMVYERELAVDPNQSGCLTVTAWYTHKKQTKHGVKKIKVFRERTKYHTLEAIC